MVEIYFVNYYQSKKHKQRYKINELLYEAIRKFQIKIPRRALGLRVPFLTVRGRWEQIILSAWICHFLYFYFVTNLQKRNKCLAYIRLHLTPPSSLYKPVCFYLNPPPSLRARILYGWPVKATYRSTLKYKK